VYFECVWLLYCRFFDCVLVLFVIKYFTKYTLCCRTHLTTLSHLLAVGGVTLGFIFDEHLTFSNQISALSKSCYYHIRELRCIRPYLDFKTASTIATSIVHSKLDYYNSFYHNLPNHQLNRLQQIQNSLARAVAKAPKSSHVNQST